MAETFNTVYGDPDTFYYGTHPTAELVNFLQNAHHPHEGEALDLGCGEGRNALFLAQYGFHVHALDQAAQGIHKLEKYARVHNLQNMRYTIADAREFALE